MPFEFQDFTLFDMGVLLVVGFSALLALMRGFAYEVMSLVGLSLAAYGTFLLTPFAAPWLYDYIRPEWLARGVALAGIFLLLSTAFSVFARRLMLLLINRSRASTIDHVLGFGFGAARGSLIVVTAYLAFTLVLPGGGQPLWMSDAVLLPSVRAGAAVLLRLLPIHLAAPSIETFWEDFPFLADAAAYATNLEVG